MLVLTRKPNESIKIGQDIEVIVLEIHGDRVKLGFVAPAEVPIHRREVHDRIDCRRPGTCGVRVSAREDTAGSSERLSPIRGRKVGRPDLPAYIRRLTSPGSSRTTRCAAADKSQPMLRQ